MRITNYTKRKNARFLCIQGIYLFCINPINVAEIISILYDSKDQNSIDKPLFESLIEGTLSSIEAIDSYLRPLLDRPIEHIDFIELSILRLALYEIIYVDQMDTKISINEAVELAKIFGSDDSYKFINGLLAKVVL